jgi:hypothetical protein
MNTKLKKLIFLAAVISIFSPYLIGRVHAEKEPQSDCELRRTPEFDSRERKSLILIGHESKRAPTTVSVARFCRVWAGSWRRRSWPDPR